MNKKTEHPLELSEVPKQETEIEIYDEPCELCQNKFRCCRYNTIEEVGGIHKGPTRYILGLSRESWDEEYQYWHYTKNCNHVYALECPEWNDWLKEQTKIITNLEFTKKNKRKRCKRTLYVTQKQKEALLNNLKKNILEYPEEAWVKNFISTFYAFTQIRRKQRRNQQAKTSRDIKLTKTTKKWKPGYITLSLLDLNLEQRQNILNHMYLQEPEVEDYRLDCAVCLLRPTCQININHKLQKVKKILELACERPKQYCDAYRDWIFNLDHKIKDQNKKEQPKKQKLWVFENEFLLVPEQLYIDLHAILAPAIVKQTKNLDIVPKPEHALQQQQPSELEQLEYLLGDTEPIYYKPYFVTDIEEPKKQTAKHVDWFRFSLEVYI